MLSTNAICYEGIIREYRNAVVRHIRKIFSEIYGDNWEEVLVQPFQKEWETIKTNAQTPRNTGTFDAPLKDSADLLGVNHFYNLFNTHFDHLFEMDSTIPSEDKHQAKREILEWARTIKQMRDPGLGHSGEVDISIPDAYRMLDSARRIVQFFDSETAGKIADLRDSLVAGDETDSIQTIQPPRVVEASTLPPKETVVPTFVGRQTELGLLKNWLLEPYSRVWLLAGDGGKGKTAIAYEFATSTLQDPPPELDVIIWLSAKARRFLSGHSMQIEAPDFTDLESALDWVLRAYGAPDIESKDISTKEDECRIYLSQLPALIVLDDVDSLEGNNLESVISYFLYRTPAMNSKILLTSRRVPLGMQHTQVKGFEIGSAEGTNFVDSRIKMYDLDQSQFDRGTINNILQVCDGSPLYIQDLLRLCKVGERPDSAISIWKREEGETARRYALERELEMLSDQAKNVLLSCSLYEGPASLPEIRVACDINEMACHDAIQELQDLFLVPKPQLIEDEPRFSLNINTRQLVLDVLGKTDAANRILSAIQVVTGQTQVTPGHRKQVGQYIRQAVSHVKLDEHREAEDTLLQAAALFPENADLHGILGWVYKAWKPRPRIADAKGQFTRAAALKLSQEAAYLHWWDLEKLQSEWSSAAQVAELGLGNVGKSEELHYRAGFARSQLAKDLYQQAQFSRAVQEATKAEDHLRSALLDPEHVREGRYYSQRRVHRALVINCEHLVRISQAQHNESEENRNVRRLARALDRWKNEHPDDSNAWSERQRLQYRFPALALANVS